MQRDRLFRLLTNQKRIMDALNNIFDEKYLTSIVEEYAIETVESINHIKLLDELHMVIDTSTTETGYMNYMTNNYEYDTMSRKILQTIETIRYFEEYDDYNEESDDEYQQYNRLYADY